MVQKSGRTTRNKHPRWFSRETLVSERGMKENE
jgi:hypothetical protein